jgi:hypothetical protein
MEYMKRYFTALYRLGFITCIGVAESHSWATGCNENIQGDVLQTVSDGWDVAVRYSRRQPRHGFVFVVFLLIKQHQNTKIMHSL